MQAQGPPSAVDLSRPRLRQLAHWIRDDIDPVVAQEGHDKLRPDDVLALHDFFQALRHSNTVTALDLRATGIHRAVMDVAGLATRWPGRLANECDQLIAAWTAKFGPLSELHPFMYGRGGRLEGIAGPNQHSKEALLKRWREICPERIATKKSHRHGSLGFKAGHWWINALFAHHAGIIDLDTTEGGICFDDYGAYAVLLKETGEIEASSEEAFTYRCARGDKGRFRLTAAKPQSRYPIRILRSHKLNSIWGPKAGVRYEGLYRVTGWTVRPAKLEDTFGVNNATGDIIFEVHFERDDPVPFSEVAKHPVSSELDDYAEYKRLQRVVHNGRYHRSHTKRPSAGNGDGPLAQKVAPAIPPVISAHKSMLELPTPLSTRSTLLRQKNDQLDQNASTPALNKPSPVQSSRSTPSQRSQQDLISEVAPWIDYEPELVSSAGLGVTPNLLPGTTMHRQFSEQLNTPTKSSTHSTSMKRASPGRTTPSFNDEADRKETGKAKDLRSKTSSAAIFKKGTEGRRTMVIPKRSRSPRSKHLDGANSDEIDDYFSFPSPRSHSRAASVSRRCSTPVMYTHRRSISAQESSKPLWSPLPWKPVGMGMGSGGSTSGNRRRNAMCILSGFASMSISHTFEPETGSSGLENISKAMDKEDGNHSPPVDVQSPAKHQVPLSLKCFISEATAATPVSVTPQVLKSPRWTSWDADMGPFGERDPRKRLGRLMGRKSSAEYKIVFKNPFEQPESETPGRKRRVPSDGVEKVSPWVKN